MPSLRDPQFLHGRFLTPDFWFAAPGLDYIPRNLRIPQRRNVMSVAVAKHAKGPGADAKHNLKAVREAYYDKISKYDMAPLWEVLKNVVTSEPKTKCVPRSGSSPTSSG